MGCFILQYEIAVTFVSVVFIIFLYIKAQWFKLRKLEAVIIGITLSLDVMLFPVAFTYQWVWLWLVLTIGLILGASFWPRQIHANKNEQDAFIIAERQLALGNAELQETADRAELQKPVQNVKLEVASAVEENDGVDSKITEVKTEEVHKVETDGKHKEELTFEELIDYGFTAKMNGKYSLAADYFTQALLMNPSPDVALSIMVDLYWLWKTTGREDHALSWVRYFKENYFDLLDSQLANQYLEWIEKENIFI